MHIAICKQRELMAVIVSYGYETADWIDEDDIDMTGLTVQSCALDNVLGGCVHECINTLVTLRQKEPLCKPVMEML